MVIDLVMPFYVWIKVGHVVSLISWMAGMFYLPRLFVYHVEKGPVGSETDQVFRVMERKLLRLIMNPAMIATWVFGLIMLGLGAFDWSAAWSWIKIAAVIGMSGMHGWLSARQRDFEMGQNTRSGRTFRLANEVPTVLMVIIVVMVVARPF